MKRLLKTPSGFAIFASWALSLAVHAQTNTNTYYAELNQQDRRDVAIQAPYSPFANQTEVNRYGDDGSAAIVDSSGMIIWRTSSGGYYALPGSQVSKPLFVSNSECIVWRNAYESTPALRVNIKLSYFRLDGQSGTVNEMTAQVDGNKVLETPLITTTTVPYTLVTANVQDLPPTTNLNLLKNLFVYRLTYNTQTPQLLSATVWSQGGLIGNDLLDDQLPLEFLYSVETVAISADGSQIVRLIDKSLAGEYLTDDPYLTEFLWVSNDGTVKPVFSATDPFVTASGLTFAEGCFTGNAGAGVYPSIRSVDLSSTKFIFGSQVGATPLAALYNYSRDAVSNQVYVETPITLTPPGNIVPVQNFNQKGFSPVFVNQNGTTVSMFRLNGVTASLLFSATLPSVLGTDFTVTRLNVNAGFESCAIRDTTNNGIVWLHSGLGRNLVTGSSVATTNFSLIDEVGGLPLFVTPGEMLVWTNSQSEVLPDGSLPPVIVKHYGRDAVTGMITALEIKVLADATDPNAVYPGKLRGTQVFSPFPLTQDPELWKLETGEKVSETSLRIRRYQLMNPSTTDEDGDGILGGYETGPYYVIPGTFTYAEAATDAERRGGHLATIADAAEFTRMQAAITLWQRNSPLALPRRVVPYPLWLGLDAVTNKWDDGITVYGNWATGEPSATPGRTRGRLTPAQQWEAVNPAQTSGYLLELPVTDPLAMDTDADGASDYDELFRLITDPLVSNFGPGSVIPTGFNFGDALVNGNYEGFLTQFQQGPISSFTLSVTNKGAFTGRVNGVSGSATFRGTFSSSGVVTMIPVSFGGATTAYLSMGVKAPLDPMTSLPVATGPYRISGQLTGLNPGTLVFELRRAAYSKTSPTTDAGDYTIAIPSDAVPKAGQPYGDGYLSGAIGQDGRTSLRGYTSDGMALSWSGNLLEGDFLSFFCMLKSNTGFVGSNLFLRDSAEVDDNYGLVGESDLDGNLLVMRKAVTSGASQIAGYGFRSEAYGSKYLPVSYAQLPSFADFVPQMNNTVMSFIDGAFSGQNVIATWNTKNEITVPKTQTRTLKAKINDKTGVLSGTYQYNDPITGYANTKATLGGVVLQKSGEVRGYYTAGTGSGQVVLLPNLDGSSAPVTLIAPRSRTGISEFGATYKIYVTASEPWSVVVPVSWVTVTPRSGTGNAELVVTVVRNSTSLRRECDLTIAGLNHHIEQDWNRTGGGSSVTISPVVRTVNYLGASYTVTVTGLANGTLADFSSPVDWVTVTAAADLKSATVTVLPWPYAESGYTYTPRSIDVTIGGVSHKVIQTSYYYYWYW